MRRQLGSMFLLGAAMGMAATASLAAQNATAHAVTASRYPIELAVTYDAMRSNETASSSFWMQGGSVELEGQFYRGLGLVADIAGMHTASINSTGVGLDMVTATFGLRYTWQPAHRRYALFGQSLVGVANGFNSVFPAVIGATSVANSAALKMGGGMNVALSPRIALRAFDAEWVRTQLPNAGSNVQNNLSLGAGIVVRFR